MSLPLSDEQQCVKKTPLHGAGMQEPVSLRGEQKHWEKASDTQAPNQNTGQQQPRIKGI